jgi:hypothetical protein
VSARNQRLTILGSWHDKLTIKRPGKAQVSPKLHSRVRFDILQRKHAERILVLLEALPYGWIPLCKLASNRIERKEDDPRQDPDRNESASEEAEETNENIRVDSVLVENVLGVRCVVLISHSFPFTAPNTPVTIFHNGLSRCWPIGLACSSRGGMYVLGSYTALMRRRSRIHATSSAPAMAPLVHNDVRNVPVLYVLRNFVLRCQSTTSIDSRVVHLLRTIAANSRRRFKGSRHQRRRYVY